MIAQHVSIISGLQDPRCCSLGHRGVFSKVRSPRLHSTAMKPFHGLVQSGCPAQSTLMFPMYSANVHLLHHSDFHLARSCQTDRLGEQTDLSPKQSKVWQGRESHGKAEQSKAQERKAQRSTAVFQFLQNHHSTIQIHKASKTLQQKGRSWAISHRCVSSAL